MASFTERMMGAARCDVATYEEVEHDEGALGQAMGVVALSSVAAGIGSLGSGGVGMLVGSTIGALLGWGVWALIAYVVGTKLLPEPTTQADLGQVLRTTGFAAAPGVLRVFGVIPLLGWIVTFVVAIWMLVTMVVAVRQALDYTTTMRAVGVVVVGWVVFVVVGILLSPRMMMTGLAMR